MEMDILGSVFGREVSPAAETVVRVRPLLPPLPPVRAVPGRAGDASAGAETGPAIADVAPVADAAPAAAAAEAATPAGAGDIKVEATGLSSWYGHKHVLDEVSLPVRERAITALVGPSGCGKSTFLRCINRMNDLVKGFRMSGRLTLDGRDVYARSMDLPALRRGVGMVFQHPNPFPMSIYDNIALAVREHAPRTRKAALDEIVERSLSQASLWDEVRGQLTGSAFALSGGQQQRLCIARALAVQPEVLMLDEPCASLDPSSTARIEELLKDLRRHYTIVIVTHNLAQARRISDHMAFFLMGKLVEHGPSAAMLERPAHAETRDYFGGAFG